MTATQSTRRRKAGNGSGTVYRRKNEGRWCWAFIGPDGKRVIGYAATQADAIRLRDEARRRVASGTMTSDPSLTFATYMKSWLATAEPTVRESTFIRYESLTHRHIIPAIGRVKLVQLTPGHLQTLYANLLGRGLSPASVHHVHAVVRRALGRAVRLGLVTRNVATLVDPPRVRRTQFRTLSSTETQTLLRAARGHRLEALIVVAVTTGMRQGELLGLPWDCVDVDAGIITVRHSLGRGREGLVVSTTKSGRGRRVMLSDLAITALGRHRVTQDAERHACSSWRDSGLVFTSTVGGPVDPTNVLRKVFYPLLERAGLPRVRFHDLRHGAATLMLQAGVHPKIVSETLGHAGITITLDTYSHVLPSMGAQVAQAFDDLLAEPTGVEAQ